MTNEQRVNLASSMPLLSSMLVAGILHANVSQVLYAIGVGLVFGLAAKALYRQRAKNEEASRCGAQE
jgi:hypothetical protein